MSEMTLERACEILTNGGAEGMTWSPSGDGQYANGIDDMEGEEEGEECPEAERMEGFLAIAIAKRMEQGVSYGSVHRAIRNRILARSSAAQPQGAAGGDAELAAIEEARELLAVMVAHPDRQHAIAVESPVSLDGYISNVTLRYLLAAAESSEHYRQACIRQSHEVEQVLGKALGYPEDPTYGLVIGDHVAESLADEAADRIRDLEAKVLASRPAAGEATRKVLEGLAEEVRRYPQHGGRYPIVGLATKDEVFAAIRECGMDATPPGREEAADAGRV